MAPLSADVGFIVHATGSLVHLSGSSVSPAEGRGRDSRGGCVVVTDPWPPYDPRRSSSCRCFRVAHRLWTWHTITHTYCIVYVMLLLSRSKWSSPINSRYRSVEGAVKEHGTSFVYEDIFIGDNPSIALAWKTTWKIANMSWSSSSSVTYWILIHYHIALHSQLLVGITYVVFSLNPRIARNITTGLLLLSFVTSDDRSDILDDCWDILDDSWDILDDCWDILDNSSLSVVVSRVTKTTMNMVNTVATKVATMACW